MQLRRGHPLPWRVAGTLLMLAASIAGSLAAPVRADVVTTKDGKTYEGKVVSQDDHEVVIETTFDGRHELARADVTKVDTTVPPLREQLAFRLTGAKDAPALVELAGWAKGKGFKAEVDDVWKKVIALDPQNAKAHKALGHVKVGTSWMSPEEKAAADLAAEEAAMKAKGLVKHEGRWVTPAEKEALEKGLLKDGDDWVTEEEFHRRRGEQLVDGKWIRKGEAEGKARVGVLAKAMQAELTYLWGPHVDLFHELAPEEGKKVLEAAENAVAAFYKMMKPVDTDRIASLRIEIVCAAKVPAYARYAQKFADENGITKLVGFEMWPSQASRMTSWFWTDPKCAVAAYLFPNTIAVLQSAVAHSVVHVLLNRYRFNYRFSPTWLAEGLAYFLEVETLGKSSTYTIGRGGIPGGADPALWQDSAKWRDQLKALAVSGQDTAFARLAGSQGDGFSLPDLVKAWSVVDLLVTTDRAKWKTFVDATKERDREVEDALRAVYGMDFKQLEAKWHALAVNGFKAP